MPLAAQQVYHLLCLLELLITAIEDAAAVLRAFVLSHPVGLGRVVNLKENFAQIAITHNSRALRTARSDVPTFAGGGTANGLR